MQRQDLPPLDLLEPFEAAARLGSFTRAAEELAVTQSAISQRVRKLEDLLGLSLFERHHRAIALTPEGRELLNGVTAALRHLGAATHGLRQQAGRPRVTLGVDTSIARLWLAPRLAGLLSPDPCFDIDLTVSDVEGEMLENDVAILHGDGNWPGHQARPLFRDRVFPVCAPGYLRRHPIGAAQDLLDADLIDLDYIHWNWMNWRIWFTEAGLAPSQARTLLRTNSYTSQIDAARAGLGVALGWAHLLDEELGAGRLVRPLPESVTTEFGYYLLLRAGAEASARHLAERLCSADQYSGSAIQGA